MNFDPFSSDEIIRLWSTTVMKKEVPRAVQVNPILAGLGDKDWEALELNSEPAAEQRLYAQIENGARKYLSRAGLNGEERIRVAARFEVHGLGS